MRIKIGQVGVGHLGERHCAALSQIPKAELAGIFDINLEKSLRISKTHRIKSFTVFEDLLAEVEALIVAVPTRYHFEIVQKALSHKVHVFVEKPITTTVAEADELIRIAEKQNLILQVGHIERFNPALQALSHEALIPMFIESHRLASFNPRGTDVAVVLDLMIHDLDIILNLVKSPIQRIDASGVAVISPEIDIANARIKFENGCVANVTASRISHKKMRKMRLFQKDAYISIDFLNRYTEVYRLSEVSSDDENSRRLVLGQIDKNGEKQITYEKLEGRNYDPLKMELLAFLKAVISREKPLVDGNAARKVLGLATEITRIIEDQNSKLAV